MEEFIVLGQVPGTSIQIDFFMWLKVAALFAGMMIIIVVHRSLSRRSYKLSPPVSEHRVFVSEPFKAESNTQI